MTRVPKRARLEAGDWIAAALVELADSGISGVRVERLATKLGVTKGSFYWHFKDRSDLQNRMLDAWRKRATLLVMDRVQKSGATPKLRLDELLRLPFASPRAPEGADVELAIRIWGRSDKRARVALTEIDELRMRFITSVFIDMGFDGAGAEARAALVYGFMRVGTTLPHEIGLDELLAKVAAALVRPEMT